MSARPKSDPWREIESPSTTLGDADLCPLPGVDFAGAELAVSQTVEVDIDVILAMSSPESLCPLVVRVPPRDTEASEDASERPTSPADPP